MVGRPRFRYSRWDGTQTGFELGGEDVLGEITDDLLFHGDLAAALRRMMESGFTAPSGDHVRGLHEMLEELRRRRRERLEQHDLGGVYEDVAERIREVVDLERTALDELLAGAEASGDDRRHEITADEVANRRLQLDLLPPDLAGLVRELDGNYDFVSDEARERLDELTAGLREQLANRWFQQISGAMSDPDPAVLDRSKDMFADLNRMLADRAAGLEPDFEAFMERHGDLFPGNPRDLDELLEVMARRMAAMQAMLNSMSPEQRRQLQELSDQLLEDIDLRWQMEQLADNLRGAFPDLPWDRSYDFSGADPLDLGDAVGIMNELGDLDQMEMLLRDVTGPGGLGELDLDRVRDLLGDEIADDLERLRDLQETLEASGLAETRDGRLTLTPAGLRRIGRNALDEIFSLMDRDRFGQHETIERGFGHERSMDTAPYEFGDPFNLHVERTIRNAIRRTGGGLPVRLSPEDFEIESTERTVRSATVLMVDLSLSMPMRGNFLPAKKVAMALHTLITTRFPRDHLDIVGFSSTARRIRPDELPGVSWDDLYGTNMHHGFRIARQLLRREHGTKQIIMITDGEPTAHLTESGRPFFSYPPVRETIDATLRQVRHLTREDIRINTFVLDATPPLREFVEHLTRMNRGRAFFTSPENLGDHVLVDFLESRRRVRGGRAG